MLYLAITHLGPSFDFLPSDISVRSLCAAGTNAFLCGGVDTDTIRLLRRWISDRMLHCVHIKVGTVLSHFSQKCWKGVTQRLSPSNMFLPYNFPPYARL